MKIITISLIISAISSILSVALQAYALKKSYDEFMSENNRKDGRNSSDDSSYSGNGGENHPE